MAAAASYFERIQPVLGPHDQEACAAEHEALHWRQLWLCRECETSDCNCTPETPSLRLPWYSRCFTACPVPSMIKHIGCAAISTGKESTAPLSSVLLPDILTSWYSMYLPGGTVTCREQCTSVPAQAMQAALCYLRSHLLCHHAFPSFEAPC